LGSPSASSGSPIDCNAFIAMLFRLAGGQGFAWLLSIAQDRKILTDRE
jgi:hypothetical protein